MVVNTLVLPVHIKCTLEDTYTKAVSPCVCVFVLILMERHRNKLLMSHECWIRYSVCDLARTVYSIINSVILKRLSLATLAALRRCRRNYNIQEATQIPKAN